MAGLERVPVRVLNTNEVESLEIALIENLQREDLNAIEEARGYRRLLTEYQMTQAELADKVSKSRSAITNALRLLDLPEEVQELVYEGQLTAGHARAVLSVPDETARMKLAAKIVEDGLSVREAENLARLYAAGQTGAGSEAGRAEVVQARWRASCAGYWAPTSGSRQAKDKGKIEIEFHGEEELERIFALLTEGAASSEEVDHVKRNMEYLAIGVIAGARARLPRRAAPRAVQRGETRQRLADEAHARGRGGSRDRGAGREGGRELRRSSRALPRPRRGSRVAQGAGDPRRACRATRRRRPHDVRAAGHPRHRIGGPD